MQGETATESLQKLFLKVVLEASSRAKNIFLDNSHHSIKANLAVSSFASINDGSLIPINDSATRFRNMVLCVLEAKRSYTDSDDRVHAQIACEIVPRWRKG